ncbi:helix-turn-helix domain-containing protein [Streptomyces pratens]|uniref:Helix-turn-helix domain-containing protein n=1 Tax=Streptomyces pratens TaxID=887456 RepID=A0ABW1M134_9ACTN
MNPTSAGVSVKNLISSSRLISGNPRSSSSSLSENTRVATPNLHAAAPHHSQPHCRPPGATVDPPTVTSQPNRNITPAQQDANLYPLFLRPLLRGPQPGAGVVVREGRDHHDHVAITGKSDPGAARTRAEYVALPRRLKKHSGLTFRRLEQRAAEHGDVLARSTVADILRRDTLPRAEVVAALVRACGAGQDVAAWLEARDGRGGRGGSLLGPDDRRERGQRPPGVPDRARVTATWLGVGGKGGRFVVRRRVFPRPRHTDGSRSRGLPASPGSPRSRSRNPASRAMRSSSEGH